MQDLMYPASLMPYIRRPCFQRKERPLTWTCRFHSPLHTLSHLFPGQPIAGVMLLFERVAWLLYHLWAASIEEASD